MELTLDRTLGGLHGQFGRCPEEINPSWNRTTNLTSLSLVTVPTELSENVHCRGNWVGKTLQTVEKQFQSR